MGGVLLCTPSELGTCNCMGLCSAWVLLFFKLKPICIPCVKPAKRTSMLCPESSVRVSIAGKVRYADGLGA